MPVEDLVINFEHLSIQAAVSAAVAQLRDKIEAGYPAEDRLIIACPTADQLLVGLG
jgi:hypothetical protein